MANIIAGKKVAVIASDNGIGHIKRSIILANQLASFYKKTKFTFFANQSKKITLKNEIKLKDSIQFKNFSPNIEKLLKLKNPFANILKSIPDLKNYHIVISDNLPEVILKNMNTILFANFLWSDLYSNQKKEYQLRIKNLLEKYKPIAFQNYLFGMKLSKYSFKKIHKLNFFEFRLRKHKKIKNSILFSVGNTIDDSIDINKVMLILSKLPIKYKIYIEPRYFDDSLPKNFYKMSFSKKNISKMEYAIIRPGLGTTYLCIENDISIFVLNSSNKEMKFNANIIKKNKIGLNFNNKFLNTLRNFNKNDYSQSIAKIRFLGKNNFKKIIDRQFKLFLKC